jgi:effector-binding domain-containing protein
MIDPPRIVQTQPLHYAALRQVCALDQISKVMGPGIGEVLAALQAQNVSPCGPWFTHHFHRPVETFDFEICFPVETPIQPHGNVNPGVWPAMTVARTVYYGNYSGLPHAWPELEQWMLLENHPRGTDFWERYLVNPDSTPDPAQWQTELNWPLA